MTSSRSCFVYAAVLVAVAFARPALAQDGKITVSVNFGAQGGSGDITQTLSPTIYLEPANIDIAQTYENGPLVDIGGSYMLFGKWSGKVGVGVSYNHTSGDGTASVSAQIPDPKVYNSPRSAAFDVNSLNHVENAVHIDALYRFAATPKIDVTVGLGPTFFSMKQDFVTDVNVAETVSPPGPYLNPTVTPITSTVSKSAVGFNLSADATYMVTKMFGAGLLIRFTHANPSLDVPNTPQAIGVRAGGFQFGVGGRVRF